MLFVFLIATIFYANFSKANSWSKEALFELSLSCAQQIPSTYRFHDNSRTSFRLVGIKIKDVIKIDAGGVFFTLAVYGSESPNYHEDNYKDIEKEFRVVCLKDTHSDQKLVYFSHAEGVKSIVWYREDGSKASISEVRGFIRSLP